MPQHECPKCQGPMAEGFILDEIYARYAASSWVAGPPQTNWMGSVKTGSAVQKDITAWRCNRCGYLELYAP